MNLVREDSFGGSCKRTAPHQLFRLLGGLKTRFFWLILRPRANNIFLWVDNLQLFPFSILSMVKSDSPAILASSVLPKSLD